jgi:hypothetical protein
MFEGARANHFSHFASLGDLGTEIYAIARANHISHQNDEELKQAWCLRAQLGGLLLTRS